jgi:hypothetical protein
MNSVGIVMDCLPICSGILARYPLFGSSADSVKTGGLYAFLYP